MIVDLLRAIRSRYDDARKTGAILVSDGYRGHNFYIIRDPAVAEWMDQTRAQALEVFGEICRDAGLPAPAFPRHRPRRW